MFKFLVFFFHFDAKYTTKKNYCTGMIKEKIFIKLNNSRKEMKYRLWVEEMYIIE